MSKKRETSYKEMPGTVIKEDQKGVLFQMENRRLGLLPMSELEAFGLKISDLPIEEPISLFVSNKTIKGKQCLCLYYENFGRLRFAPIVENTQYAKELTEYYPYHIIRKHLLEKGFSLHYSHRNIKTPPFHELDISGEEGDIFKKVRKFFWADKDVYVQLVNYYKDIKLTPDIRTGITLAADGLITENGDLIDAVGKVLKKIEIGEDDRMKPSEDCQKDESSTKSRRNPDFPALYGNRGTGNNIGEYATVTEINSDGIIISLSSGNDGIIPVEYLEQHNINISEFCVGERFDVFPVVRKHKGGRKEHETMSGFSVFKLTDISNSGNVYTSIKLDRIKWGKNKIIDITEYIKKELPEY